VRGSACSFLSCQISFPQTIPLELTRLSDGFLFEDLAKGMSVIVNDTDNQEGMSSVDDCCIDEMWRLPPFTVQGC